MVRFLVIILYCILAVVPSGCLHRPSLQREALEEEGEVYLYLQPFPQEAQRLRFVLTGISALRGDGARFPCSLNLGSIKADEMRRQRYAASCRLEPGAYAGFQVSVREAALRTAEGEASLLVPEQPTALDAPFQIRKKKAQALFLSLNYPETVKDGFSFRPAFSVLAPPRPVTALGGFLTNTDSDTITVFDRKLGQVVDVVATGRRPMGIVLDQQRMRVFVALAGEDAVEVFDSTSGESLARIGLQAGDAPSDIALTPDGRTLLVTDAGMDTLSFIDPQSFLERDRLAVGRGPAGVLIDGAGMRAYVFNSLASSITIVDIPNRSVAGLITTEPGPFRGQFDRKGGRLYVISEHSPYLSVLDPAGAGAPKRIFVGGEPGALKVDTATDMIYVSKRRGIGVDIYDPFSFFPAGTIATAGGVDFLAIDGEENNLYLLAPERRALSAVNVNSRNEVFRIDTGESPYGVAVTGGR